MTDVIPALGCGAAAYLAWFTWRLIGGVRVVRVPLRRRSLRAISGYRAGPEGARNGGYYGE